jgi:hypothetical protein
MFTLPLGLSHMPATHSQPSEVTNTESKELPKHSKHASNKLKVTKKQ